MRTPHDVKALLSQVLSYVSAPEASVSLHDGAGLATRFGENAVTQNMSTRGAGIRVTAAYGQRQGSSVTNKLDDDSLRAVVARAETIAQEAPEDPEHVPLPGPQTYPDVPQRCFSDVVDLTPSDLAERVASAVGRAKAAGYVASGLCQSSYGISGLANTRGLVVTDTTSDMSFSVTMHGPKGSGAASGSGESLSQVDANALAERALQTARAAQNPRDIEPGDYTVIFEPQATADLLGFLLWNLGARQADEGTTVFAGKVRERVAGENVTIRTEIDDPELPACHYGEDGLPSRRMTWIRKGVLQRLNHNRYWAREKNTEPDPIMFPVTMSGGDNTVDGLIARCGRGLLIKRLWYIRYVDQKELLLTGMTRDGVFLVEDGRVIAPVINLRFNESPMVFLRNIVAMTPPERVGGMKVPAVMSTEFTFSSKTASV